ncbi:Uncharacterised protein [Shigella sonnei]|nr:Uncharacterised protein [Shigella sonnei]
MDKIEIEGFAQRHAAKVHDVALTPGRLAGWCKTDQSAIVSGKVFARHAGGMPVLYAISHQADAECCAAVQQRPDQTGYQRGPLF